MSKANTLAQLVSTGNVLADGAVATSEVTGLATLLADYLTSSTAASTYQTTLVSGTNIKTVNGNSILGSGNIQIDGGVTSFNTRTGAITLDSNDVTTALGFTPYNSTNPSGYITSSDLSGYLTSSTAASTYLPLAGGTLTGTIYNQAAYSAPSSTASYGSKVLIQGSTGVGQANATGGNGHIEVLGGGATSIWTSFVGGVNVRKRGGILLLSGLAQGDSGGTWSFGSTIEIRANSGTNNGTNVGNGGLVSIGAGNTTTTDSLIQYGSGMILSGASAGTSGGLSISAGAFQTSQGINTGANISIGGSTSTMGGNINLTPGGGGIAGATAGKVFIARSALLYEALDTGNYSSYAPTLTGTGASGTWGISVSGNAATVTNGLTTSNYTSYAPSLTGSGASGTWGISITGTASYSNYQAATGTSNDWVTSFQNTPAHNTSFREMSANGPSGTWWFMQNLRHSNGTNYWGTQLAWGWEDNANRLLTRNITGNSWGSWVEYVNNTNFNRVINRGTWSRETSGGTMVSGNTYSVYTGGGALTMYLPSRANCANGDKIYIQNLHLTWAAANFTIARSDSNTYINYIAENLVCNVNVASIVLTCHWNDGTNAFWGVAPGG